MPRLSNIDNLSYSVKEQSCRNHRDVYDYNVGMESFSDTQLAVRCYISNPEIVNDPSILLMYFYFRIKFVSTNVSKQLQEILDAIGVYKKDPCLNNFFKVCRKTKKYLFEYYCGELYIFGTEITNTDDLYVQNYEILKTSF